MISARRTLVQGLPGWGWPATACSGADRLPPIVAPDAVAALLLGVPAIVVMALHVHR